MNDWKKVWEFNIEFILYVMYIYIAFNWFDYGSSAFLCHGHTFAYSRLVGAKYSHFRDLRWYVANSGQILHLRSSTR